MSRFHDPEAPVCACLNCTEARYHAAAAAAELAEREAVEWARAEAEFAARQLRLPIPGLPHVAHPPSHL